MQHLSENDINNFLLNLTNFINNSSAVSNDFYTIWENNKLSTENIEIILANYFARTINTVARVSDVINRLIDPLRMIKDYNYRKVVVENMHNLEDELGSNDPDHMHVILLANWINEVLNRMGSKLVPIENHFEQKLTEETKLFIKEQENLYRDQSIHVVIGASFTQEIIADHMMKKIKNGYINNYQSIFPTAGDFYQTTGYFAAHVFGTEENHAKLACNVISAICKNNEDLEKITQTAHKFIDITSKFWAGIVNQLNIS
ncbi:MAG: iron-containing redox enzyme family protein [Alphaproteobacteria bacterium]